MAHLPYRLKTEFGEEFDVLFPLHDQTESAVRVSQFLTTVLSAVDREIAAFGDTANGDVLQALAMALAVRARTVPVPFDVSKEVSLELAQVALDALGDAGPSFPTIGTA